MGMWQILLLLFSSVFVAPSQAQQEMRADPAPIIYPGQVNIGLISNVHGPAVNGSGGCGPLRPEAVQRAMAAVWAAHQANFRKDDPQELNIGVYIYDTCGREDVAERQVYRLLGHVGHVQTTDCSEKRIPALFAAITEGDTDSLRIPLKLLQAFSVPVISTSGEPLPKTLSTAPSAEALARAAVSILRHLRLLEVAVMAEDEPPMGLFQAFTRQAQVSGMQAIHLDNGTDHRAGDEDVLATLKLVSEYGKSRLKAVVFLIGSEQALQLLNSVDDHNLPQIPWVIVTPSDISAQILTTFQRQQIRRLQKILLLSPESVDVPEFDDYFQQLLDEETIKYHPLLMEFLQVVGSELNTTGTLPEFEPFSTLLPNFTNDTNSPKFEPGIYPADVSSIVKAVWTLSAALKTVQRRSCRRGTDCLLYLRRSLSSYVARAAAGIDHIVDSGSETLKGTRLNFDKEGVMTSTKYGLRGFTFRGDIKEVGFYSDDEGLNIDRHVMETFTEAPSAETVTPITLTPRPDSKFKLKPDKVLPTPNPTASSVAEEKASTKANGQEDFSEWKIFEDTAGIETTTQKVPATPPSVHHAENDLDLVVSLHDDSSLQSLSSGSNASSSSGLAASRIGPAYDSGDRTSSNLRSISLTSHQEPRINDAYTDDSRSRSPESVAPKRLLPPSPASEDTVRVVRRPNVHVSAWLGRPWALSVLGVCGFLILATLYVLVFLMVKACEGSLKKTNCCLAGTQLVALLCLYVAAALYTWKPSALLCGLQRLMPNVSLAFCYGGLLLKGMYLRAQNSLGLGGSVNRCNQMLTLIFIVGVQVALETQWWLLRPPAVFTDTLECTTGKTEILQSQIYVTLLLLMATALAISTRKIPYNQPESRSLIFTSVSCLAVFLSWDVACWLLPDAASRNVAAPAALLATGLAVLLGVFAPQLFAIHKYGGFPPHKPLSYADSLSTVFTMFKDLDNASSGGGGGTTSRGRKNAKTLETPFATEMVGEGTRNPLYSDYQSAYP